VCAELQAFQFLPPDEKGIPYLRTPLSPGLRAHRRYFQTFLVLIVELWADAAGVSQCFNQVMACVANPIPTAQPDLPAATSAADTSSVTTIAVAQSN